MQSGPRVIQWGISPVRQSIQPLIALTTRANARK